MRHEPVCGDGYVFNIVGGLGYKFVYRRLGIEGFAGWGAGRLTRDDNTSSLPEFFRTNFVVYKNEIGNDKSISGNFINALLDNDNLIWIGTSNNGICYYNKKFNNFKSIGKPSSNCTQGWRKVLL